jgi:hypothetical protein
MDQDGDYSSVLDAKTTERSNLNQFHLGKRIQGLNGISPISNVKTPKY